MPLKCDKEYVASVQTPYRKCYACGNYYPALPEFFQKLHNKCDDCRLCVLKSNSKTWKTNPNERFQQVVYLFSQYYTHYNKETDSYQVYYVQNKEPLIIYKRCWKCKRFIPRDANFLKLNRKNGGFVYKHMCRKCCKELNHRAMFSTIDNKNYDLGIKLYKGIPLSFEEKTMIVKRYAGMAIGRRDINRFSTLTVPEVMKYCDEILNNYQFKMRLIKRALKIELREKAANERKYGKRIDDIEMEGYLDVVDSTCR